MSITIVESNPLKIRGTVTIKPYFDENKENMGLEKYGLSLYDGVFHEEQLACIEMNGIKRYLTGLNEFAPEVKFIKNDDERNAKIKEIRGVVADLEKELAANILDINDPDFWNKAKLLKHDNSELWNRITIRVGNVPLFLDPIKDPYDRIRLYAINAGGFSMVAKSLEDARNMPVPPKFYLDKAEDTISTKTELKKVKNKAISLLQSLFDKDSKKLFYIAKVLDGNSTQYKKHTSNDIVYDNMDNFINGKGVDKNVLRACESFITAAEEKIGVLKLRAIIKDASFFKFISSKSDGFIYHQKSASLLGRTASEVFEYLSNPLNQDVLQDLTTDTESQWNN